MVWVGSGGTYCLYNTMLSNVNWSCQINGDQFIVRIRFDLDKIFYQIKKIELP